MKYVKLVAFDWDGTLADNAAEIYAGAVHVCRALRAKFTPTLQEYYKMYRMPWIEMYREFGITATAEEINEVFHSITRKPPVLMEGALALAERLHKEGVALYVVSASTRGHIAETLEKAGALDLFREIIDSTSIKAPVLQHLRERACTMRMYESVFVGDTIPDIKDGVAAGFMTVGLTPPELETEELLRLHGAHHCVESHKQLARLFGF